MMVPGLASDIVGLAIVVGTILSFPVFRRQAASECWLKLLKKTLPFLGSVFFL